VPPHRHACVNARPDQAATLTCSVATLAWAASARRQDREEDIEEDEAGEQPAADGFDVVQPENGASEATPAAQRITTPFLTKYERARILGTRALQIRYGRRLARARRRPR